LVQFADLQIEMRFILLWQVQYRQASSADLQITWTG